MTDVTRHVAWGPGPRVTAMLAVRARAAMEGRLAPSVDDVLGLAHPVLRHRMALNFAARADGVTLDALIDRLCQPFDVQRTGNSEGAATCRIGIFGLTKLDSRTNACPSLDQEISTADSSVRVLVIRAEEDWAIAQECWKLAQGLQRGQQNASAAHKASHKARERQANRALIKSEKG